MSCAAETPFSDIESAREYLTLLVEVVADVQREVENDLSAETTQPAFPRRAEALQLVAYNLQKLEKHLKASARLLNDLRSLRRLLLQERPLDADVVAQALKTA